MHRLLCVLTLALAPVAAQAETGPPTAEEVASAQAACAVEVRRDCLFTLAIDAALAETRLDQIPRHLNQIATAQAKAGDIEGADRTLSLTRADERALLALGRWDEAYVVAERQFHLLIVEQGTAEGSFKANMVRHMLAAGEGELALSTALSIPDGWGERDDALFLIFEDRLSNHDFAGAANAFDLMQNRDSLSRNRALLALVEAYANDGWVAAATTLLDRAGDPETLAQARLRLASALHAASSFEAAKAHFDQVSFSATGREGLPDGGISVLVDAADLALSLGETALARQQAEAAFSVIDHDREDAGSWFIYNTSNPINLIRVATLLELAGSSDKAKILFTYAALPPPERESGQQKMLRQIELLISQLRLQDPDAANATLQQLLLLQDGPDAWVLGDFLERAALALVDYGLHRDAQQIAEQMEVMPYAGGRSYEVYMALLAKDPSLAPSLLPDIRTAYIHAEVSVAWARTLNTTGQKIEAQEVLRSLVIDHAGRSKDEYPIHSGRTRALSEIAKAQASLGFVADAAETRQRGLELVEEIKLSGHSIDALLYLAESFH